MADTKNKPRPIPVVAMLLAWLVPGAGHVYLGRVTRGIVIFVVIGATFWAGVGMGGKMTMDYRGEQWWFVAQMLTGVHGLVGWQRERTAYAEIDRKVAEAPQFQDLAGPYLRGGTGSDKQAVQSLREDFTARKLEDANLALVYPTDTVARAYAGVAGLLNLLCIFDALMLAMMGVAGETPVKSPGNPEARKA